MGANRDLDAPPSETEWLTTHLHWHGLLTQPNPDIYRGVLKFARPKTLTAQVCISPTIYVKHVSCCSSITSKISLLKIVLRDLFLNLGLPQEEYAPVILLILKNGEVFIKNRFY